jgi:hypothetical protein
VAYQSTELYGHNQQTVAAREGSVGTYNMLKGGNISIIEINRYRIPATLVMFLIEIIFLSFLSNLAQFTG